MENEAGLKSEKKKKLQFPEDHRGGSPHACVDPSP